MTTRPDTAQRTGPTRAQPVAAADGTVPDLVAPGLRVLFCGIKPKLFTAWTGHHFARPGNRLWPALHSAGFAPRLLAPADQTELLTLGLGDTSIWVLPNPSGLNAHYQPERLAELFGDLRCVAPTAPRHAA